MANGGQKNPDYNKHIPIDFHLDIEVGVRPIPLRKVKATIFWRPDLDKSTGKYSYNKRSVDWNKVKELEDKIEELYPKLNFKKKNGRQVHDPSCDYDPYQKVMDSNHEMMAKRARRKEKLSKERVEKMKLKKKDKKKRLQDKRDKAKAAADAKASAEEKKEDL